MSVAPSYFGHVSNTHSLPGRSVWDENVIVPQRKDDSTPKTSWKAFIILVLLVLIIFGTIFGTIIASLMIGGFKQRTNTTERITDSSTSTLATTTVTSASTASTICSTTAITTTSTLTSLPSQCSSYTLIIDATRHASQPTAFSCDDPMFTPAKWVRFSGAAGTMLANCPVADFHCGTSASGWYSGVYPSTAGSTTNGQVCFNLLGNNCMWPTTISITNCNGYYVFYLVSPSTCDSRYCTI